MIRKENFKEVLKCLNFIQKNDIWTKNFKEFDCELKVDFNEEKLIYPKELKVNDKTTSNFSSPENFVVFECVNRLLRQGYNLKHIELEKKWQLGHTQKSGKADIYIKDNSDNSILIIECKTAGAEYRKAINILENDSRNQLFSYLQQAPETHFLALYTSDFIDNRVVSKYYLINVKDNKELLENDKSLKSYREASSVEDKWQVWCDTYDKEYSTIGLFENNKAYEIGKSKFTIDDLKPISSKDIGEKYNQFATILRKYNVSGRENAFDKLVNLFLCKVTDEKQNPKELKFYWKGKAYDSPFNFQDRLQQLYRDGMKEFLGEDITYIDNNTVDDIFKLYDLDTVKRGIKDVLKKLKFFTNNDFAFIDVHNEKLFYKNFAVLLDVARLIQDINLTHSDENQFLGDMFEGFLDQGVKQSEGQFFTPMPIVKFIINSLPKKDKPKVIDYACGAGHFLNEYHLLNRDSKIVGIEKEYRLSKVAKVSSFMYGSNIEIIHNDALSYNENIKDFNILIANPPYSVKGFLETLKEEDRGRFELIKTIDSKSYIANNAIECFFIERAKQLLAKDGVAGIIVPSSILNKGSTNINTKKGNIYVTTREIILKYFDIVAIAEFGSGTFGKTGTNTVTLFLKRRCDNINIAETFKELADKLYTCHRFDMQNILIDKDMLKKYCSHNEFDLKIYESFLYENSYLKLKKLNFTVYTKSLRLKDFEYHRKEFSKKSFLDNRLFEYDIFKEYKNTFEKLSETKNRKKRKSYKELPKEEKEALERKELIKYIKLIEKNKFYYFCLAYKNSSDVVIVKSPSKNSENKKFLGYEWSSAKGNEGIHYITNNSININSKDLDEEDKRIVENISGLKDINTPLYNPKDIDDNSKINKIIRDNFEGIKREIPEHLKEFVSRARLLDMLDFSRVEFNKALNLSPKIKVEIKSKWGLVKLEEVVEFFQKSKRPASEGLKQGKYPFFTSSSIQDKWLNEADYTEESIIIGDGGNSSIFISKLFSVSDHNFVLSSKKNTLLNQYIYEFYKTNFYLISNGLNGIGLKNISKKYIQDLKIPLPPLQTQKEIITKIEKYELKIEEAKKVIDGAKELKEKILKGYLE